MAVPSGRNISLKTIEKFSKINVKDLEIETTRMWGTKTETKPVVIGDQGLIKKELHTENTQKIPGAINIMSYKKITLLGTTHILSNVLSSKQNLSALWCPRTMLKWTGGPSGVYSRLNSKNSHSNNINNNIK